MSVLFTVLGNKLNEVKSALFTFLSFKESLVLTLPCAKFDFIVCLRDGSELITDSHPTIVQVVSPSEDLQVVPVRHQILCDFIDLFRLL